MEGRACESRKDRVQEVELLTENMFPKLFGRS